MQERTRRERKSDSPYLAQQVTPGMKHSYRVSKCAALFLSLCLFIFSVGNLPFSLFIRSYCLISVDWHLTNPNWVGYELLQRACGLLK